MAKSARRPAWGKLIAITLVLMALTAAWRFTPLAELLTRENIIEWSRAARATPWAPVAIVLSFTPAAVLMFPRPILTLLAVITFGPWLGLAYSAAGIMLAAMVTFYAGRVMRRDTVLRLAGGKLDEVSGALREHGVMAIFASNMVPVPPFAVQGIIAGAIRIKTWEYVLGSILGMAPGLLAATVFARELRAVLEDPSKISWWVFAAVIIAFGAFIWWIRRWIASKTGEHRSREVARGAARGT